MVELSETHSRFCDGSFEKRTAKREKVLQCAFWRQGFWGKVAYRCMRMLANVLAKGKEKKG